MQNNSETNQKSSLSEKFLYFGAGLAVGVVAYPALKNLAKNMSPVLKNMSESLIRTSEGVYENVSDKVAEFKQDTCN